MVLEWNSQLANCSGKLMPEGLLLYTVSLLAYIGYCV